MDLLRRRQKEDAIRLSGGAKAPERIQGRWIRPVGQGSLSHPAKLRIERAVSVPKLPTEVCDEGLRLPPAFPLKETYTTDYFARQPSVFVLIWARSCLLLSLTTINGLSSKKQRSVGPNFCSVASVGCAFADTLLRLTHQGHSAGLNTTRLIQETALASTSRSNPTCPLRI
jgi:hypothetical protein